jgi:hypothetical protein
MRSPARVLAGVSGLILIALGLWAFFAPSSFFESVATYPPYNRHLLHDLGAFMLGLGGCLGLALIWSDAPLVALAGNGVAAFFHFVSHVQDRSLGGKAADPITTGAFAVVLIAAALMRRREVSR